MSNSITIPATPEEVDTAIAGAMEVFTLGEWPLAAWLAARVRLDVNTGRAGRNADRTVGVLTPTEFADKGIRGLSSHVTVRRYVKAWLDRHDGVYPELGATVSIPTGGIPSNSKTDDTEPGAQKVRDIRNNPAATAKAMEDPTFAAKVMERSTPAAREAIASEIEHHEVSPETRRIVREDQARTTRQPGEFEDPVGIYLAAMEMLGQIAEGAGTRFTIERAEEVLTSAREQVDRLLTDVRFVEQVRS